MNPPLIQADALRRGAIILICCMGALFFTAGPALAAQGGHAALAVSASGVLVPFACGFALGQFMPAGLLPHPDQRFVTSARQGAPCCSTRPRLLCSWPHKEL